jgi:hypothetical protein
VIPEQPTAPYLDAVVAYGFRGPGRFHVPGHKGGEGADPGLRHAIGDDVLLLDIPQDIQGIDLGSPPRRTAPRAPGSSPTVRRRATTRWRWRSRRSARGSSRSATRTRRSSTASS